MDEAKLIEEVKRIIATGARGPSPSITPKFIDALFDAENKTISASALVRQLYPKELAKANAKGNEVKFRLRKTNSLEKVRRLINNRLFNTPYLFQMFITLFRGKFGILTQPEPIFEKRLARA